MCDGNVNTHFEEDYVFMLTLSPRRKRLGLFYSTIFYVNYFDREQMQVEYRNFASTDFTLPMLEMIYNCLRMD